MLHLILITGDNGIIDGQGALWWTKFHKGELKYTRPYLIEITAHYLTLPLGMFILSTAGSTQSSQPNCLLLTTYYLLDCTTSLFFFLNSNWERIDMQQCPHSRPYHHCTSHLSKSDHSDRDDASPCQEEGMFCVVVIVPLLLLLQGLDSHVQKPSK